MEKNLNEKEMEWLNELAVFGTRLIWACWGGVSTPEKDCRSRVGVLDIRKQVISNPL
jgi:hypothetical protein